jgi:MYXO-CTERM domain-containing protein
MSKSIALVIGAAALCAGVPTARAADRTFPAGSLIIPMDLSYQSRGLFQAYGLVYQLTKQGVHVHWVIDPNKSYHEAPCNTANDLCAWDCGVEGASAKCAYPTASPDFAATTTVVWDDATSTRPMASLGTHKYRGGPFVVDAADHDHALQIIDVWNDKTKWAANPWATRTEFHVVSVHEATSAFTGNSARELIAAPTIAVFADGKEDIATGYLRAAGIPQSNGNEFLAGTCGATNCGPGTMNPDMLTEEAIMGDLGTCDAPNLNHQNGALFKADGTPAYCQIMSMHWDVINGREKVQCGGANCPATRAQCAAGTKFTYNGHEVVAEVRAFLAYSTHFFAECQAVNAYENTTPNPGWPWLDDMGRDGHFLTTTGAPPSCTTVGQVCANSNNNYTCTQSDAYCGAGLSCCLPNKNTWKNLPGFEVGTQPTTAKILRPDVPYNQIDGAFGTTGGSEPSYNLSTYLPTMYKNNRQVTLVTSQAGPGVEDIYMSGYLDGCGDIILSEKKGLKHAGCEGKISYLGGHHYNEGGVPVTSGSEGAGVRMFLNALFEAQCTTAASGTDTDGDGVDDANDPAPNDPNMCGDGDGDGCDDCAGGHYDPINDCSAAGDAGLNPGTGDKSGCCETGSSGGPAMLLAFGVGLLLVRRRRRI